MDFFDLWDKVLEYIRVHDPQYYQMFTNDVFPTSMKGNQLTLSVTNKNRMRWIQNVYLKKMETILTELAGHPVSVLFTPMEETPAPGAPESTPFPPAPEPAAPVVAETPDPFPTGNDTVAPDFSKLVPKTAQEVQLPDIHKMKLEEPSLFEHTEPAEEKKQPAPVADTRVNEEYTFETFVHGNCNEMAFAAAQSVARTATDPKQADQTLNPLFIHGPSGLGKTHLLHAICNYVRQNKPDRKILFVSSETFINEFVDALGTHTMAKFRAKYRSPDYLLIDDVQFFGGPKESTQTEIFNTFNELFDKKKYIIMTSDRTPSDIDKLESRLQTRFSSGLVVPISPPDYEICCIILQKRAEKMGITLPNDVIDYIASHINTNVRELEGAFNKLVTFAHLKNEPITLPFTKEALKDQIPLDSSASLTIDTIIDTVCDYYNVRKEKLLGKTRPKNIVVPRQIAMYLCRNDLGESYPTLRDAFKRKDHSTVLYACERVEKDLEKDAQTRAAVAAIRKRLKDRG